MTMLINDLQQVAAKYHYDPYGKAGPLADANTYWFSSKEIHANSAMYYYGYRWYEPNLQRWLNRDPLGESGGINLYCFVQNRPLSSVDPFGLFWDNVPIIGTIITCMSKPGPYTPTLNLCDCKTDPASAEAACEQDIDNQMRSDVMNSLKSGAIQVGVDAIGIGIGLGIGLVNPIVGGVIDGTLAIDAAANAACTINYVINARKAAKQAKAGCKCPKE